MKQDWKIALNFYDELVSKCDRFERKGKTMPYTSANGHMFSLLNKDWELGFRFSKPVQEKYFEKYKTSYLISYNAKMKGYIMITEEMKENPNNLLSLLNESYEYVMSLDPK
jgi:hypothetical protein